MVTQLATDVSLANTGQAVRNASRSPLGTAQIIEGVLRRLSDNRCRYKDLSVRFIHNSIL
jgi:hypothetical protein